MKARKSQRFAVRLTRRERQTLDRLAAQRETTSGQLLRRALREFELRETAAK